MMERAELVFDLQFFGGEEPGGEPEGTPVDAGPAANPDNQTVSQESEELDFIDPALVPDEVKQQEYFKGMKRAYTQKTQEIAEFRKACEAAGLPPQMAGHLLSYMMNDPQGFIKAFAAEHGIELTPKEEREMAKAMTQEIEDAVADDDLADLAGDEYAAKLLELAEKRVTQKLAQKFAPIEKEFEAKRRAEAEKFLNEVNTAIDGVLKEYPNAGVTKQQLFEVAKRYQILPQDMEVALRFAVGPEKFKEMQKAKLLAEIQTTARENKQSVSPTLSNSANGLPPKQAPEKPRTIAEVTQNILHRLQTITK